MKTYPHAGETKFTALPLDEARRIANDHYDVQQTQQMTDNSGSYLAVKTLSGWSAMVGLVNGTPAILRKLPDGTRELETLNA